MNKGELLEKFEKWASSARGREAMQEVEQEEQVKETRKRAAAERTDLNETRTGKLADSQAKVQAAQKRVDDCKQAMEKALADYGDAFRMAFSVQWGINQRILELESYLRQTAPPELTQRIEELRNKAERVREETIHETLILDPSAPISGQRTYTNYKDIVSELAQINAEIADTEAKILRGE